MLAAVQAWASLADELHRAVNGYQSEVSELTAGTWTGPSSAAMSAAAASYVEWLRATAAQAEQTAAQARVAAAAYEAAFASTVPPAEVAANRSLLAALVATNFLGQNTPAIAATEALYAEMWAQDSLAMYNYAASSAAATVLTPFTPPHQNTDPGGTAGQAAAIRSVVPQALSAMAVPAQFEQFELLVGLVGLFLVAPTEIVALFGVLPADVIGNFGDFPLAGFTAASGVDDDETFSAWDGVEPWPGTGPAPVEPFVAPLAKPPAGGLPVPTMSAAVARANVIGGLTVPPSWTRTVAAEIRPTALTTPLAGANTAAAAELGAANSVNQMGAGVMAAQAMAGPPAGADGPKNGTPARPAGPPEQAPTEDVEVVPAPRTVMTGVAAAIREIAVLRAAGLLSEQEYTEQKKSLLEISFGQ